MKISHFLWLLAVILLIAALSLIYTSSQNENLMEDHWQESVLVARE